MHGRPCLVDREDYQALVMEIKDKQDEWIDLIERYNDWVMDDTDEDFDWFE